MSEPDIDFLQEGVADEVLPEETPAPESTPETVEKPPESPAAAVTTPEATREEERVPLAALMAERDKRQREAQQRAELERRLREMEQRQQPQTNFYEAPEDYVTQLVSRAEQQATQRLYAALEEQAREQYPDYDEVFEYVQSKAQENPALVQEILSKPNPAVAAYKLGKQLREMQAMQDPQAYKASLKAEILAEMKAEQAAAEDAKRKAAAAIPPNLADVRASKTEEVVPDDSLESILKR
jgi:hypothetical protein